MINHNQPHACAYVIIFGLFCDDIGFESKYAENGDVRQPYVYQSFAQNDGIIMFHPLSETGFSVGRKIPFRTA